MTHKSPESILNRVNSTQTARAPKPTLPHPTTALDREETKTFSPGVPEKRAEWLKAAFANVLRVLRRIHVCPVYFQYPKRA